MVAYHNQDQNLFDPNPRKTSQRRYNAGCLYIFAALRGPGRFYPRNIYIERYRDV